MIPGINLLNVALGVIGSQPVEYYRDTGVSVTLENGVVRRKYAAGVTIPKCSVQAVSRDSADRRGLDVNADYVEWFVPRDIVGLGRDKSGDEIEWDGRRWKIIGHYENWAGQDGWCCGLFQEIKPNASRS
ncbi:phage collar protein [Entomohabitans teleogrylli]|uniref:phage collar protein n=1 Tax=Entomohabitans teleogrylli TaxID=1384589 RepID=UPI00073D82B3|nr:hypothetical protein [Entomohabitans teleogrylli]